MSSNLYLDFLIFSTEVIIFLDLIWKGLVHKQSEETQKVLIVTHVTPIVVLNTLLVLT